MAHFLKSLMGNGQGEQTVQAEEMFARLEEERTALEAATAKAEATAQRLEQLSGPVTEMDKTVSTLKGRIGTVEQELQYVEGLVPQMASIRNQADAVDKGHRRVETQLSNAAEELERLQASVGELAHKADMALCLKEDLSGFLELRNPLQDLHVRTADLTELVEILDGNVGEVKGSQERIGELAEQTESRLGSYEDRFQQMLEGVADAEGEVDEFRRSCAELSKVATGAADTKRQIATLQALTESVTQKIAAVELQRDAVDRASHQAANLNELMRRIDVQIRAQTEKSSELNELEVSMQALQETHATLLEQTNEIRARHTNIQEADKAARTRLDSLETEWRHSTDRLTLERDGLDGVSQRIVDLRRDLSGIEGRYEKLEDSSQNVPALSSRIQDLVGRVDGAAEEIDRLGEYEQQAQAIGIELTRLDDTSRSAGARLARIEEARPAAESMLREFNELHRNRESLREALDQVQFAATEVRRFREDQTETERWMAGVQTLLNELQAKASELGGTKSTVDVIRRDLERVSELMSGVQSRAAQVEDLGENLSDLMALGAQLDERSKGLVSRMDLADGRLKSLAARAAEAAAVETSITATSASVTDLEQRSKSLSNSLEMLETQSRELAEMSARVEQLGVELDQRQQTLEKSAEHLEKSSELRREAAATAQELEDRTRELSDALNSADGRLAELTGLAQHLDDKYTGLMFAEKRLGKFEDRLAQWEDTEARVADTVDQLTERESTIQALQAEIRQLLQMAEQTVADVRSINGAKQEISEMRVELDGTLERLHAADETAENLEDRKRQIEQAESKLARSEALMLEIQSSMETLQGQKALMDHVIDKAGALTFQLKHAEAVIDTLREERDLTSKVHSAVAEVQDGAVKEKAS
jgi:DNA repair exonuclease SbcCD ATPase subunit